MRIRTTVVAVAALVAGIVIVAPGADGAAPAKATCTDAQTTLAMTQCYSDALAAAESKLRAAYAKAKVTAHSSADRTLLRKAQDAWFSFRKADCDFAAARYRGGTFAPVANLQCRLTQTNRRLADMRIYARGLPG